VRKDTKFKRYNVTQTELQLPVAQSLALFVKTIRKMSQSLHDILKANIALSLPEERAHLVLEGTVPSATSGPAVTEIANELEEGGDTVLKQLREQQREVINSLDLKQ